MRAKVPFCRLLFTWAAFTDEEQPSICMPACPLAIPLPVDTLQRTSPWPLTKLVCMRFGGWAQDLCPPHLSHAKHWCYTGHQSQQLIPSAQAAAKCPPCHLESPAGQRTRPEQMQTLPSAHSSAQPTVGSAQINLLLPHLPCLTPSSPEALPFFLAFP